MGYWWCPNCKEEVASMSVTFQEKHENCGYPVEWIEDSATGMTGIERIAAERKRQIEEEGFTAEHDDRYKKNELAMTAACYTLPEKVRETRLGLSMTIRQILWPWHEDWWKPAPKNRIRELEKAGALIAAEIDRLLWLEEKNQCNKT